MKIKGTSVKATLEYVKQNHPDRLEEWIDSLEEESKKIFTSVIMTTSWYDLYLSQIEPQRKIGKLFFDNDEKKAAYEIGKNEAHHSLNGIYKIFIRIASVDFVLKRASTIFSTYFTKEAKIIASRQSASLINLQIKGFTKKEELHIHNIIGWIDSLMNLITKNGHEITSSIKDTENGEVDATLHVKY